MLFLFFRKSRKGPVHCLFRGILFGGGGLIWGLIQRLQKKNWARGSSSVTIQISALKGVHICRYLLWRAEWDVSFPLPPCPSSRVKPVMYRGANRGAPPGAPPGGQPRPVGVCGGGGWFHWMLLPRKQQTLAAPDWTCGAVGFAHPL